MTEKLRVLDLFAGIGGFSLGLERTGGFETVAFCEIESYPQKVLAKHWPGVPIYDDVRELTAERLATDGIGVDVITGGFPCQPFSVAGKGYGERDDRFLWPEIVRLIREIHPKWFIGENVDGFIGMGLANAISDMELQGYILQPIVIPACAVGLNHRRDRVWLIANRESIDDICGMEGKSQIPELGGTASTEGIFRTGWREDINRMVGEPHGIPFRMDRVRCIGNAVVPQIPELIGLAILANNSIPQGG